jgi:retron-type reverse transcriptase
MTRSPSGIPSQSHLDHLTTVILPHAEVHRRHPTKVTFCVRGVASPLLSNLMLDVLDRELERRGHRFARYADDCVPRTH